MVIEGIKASIAMEGKKTSTLIEGTGETHMHRNGGGCRLVRQPAPGGVEDLPLAEESPASVCASPPRWSQLKFQGFPDLT